jgi:hypothetical protein
MLTAVIIRAIVLIATTMATVSISETSVYFYENTRRNIPESCHFHARRRKNLKSHLVINLFTYLLFI